MNTQQESLESLKRMDPKLYIRKVFDPIQTHAVYGVHANRIDDVKLILRRNSKATRFRIVKSSIEKIVTICYRAGN